MKRLYIVLLLTVTLASGCATDTLVDNLLEPPGFLYGFWHGLVIYVSTVGSLINDKYIVYAYPNTGYYRLGFAIGVFLVTLVLVAMLGAYGEDNKED